MRPTPREELEGVRRILAEVVAPAVTGEYAAAQLQQVITVLDRLGPSWDHALIQLHNENTSLEQLFVRLGSDFGECLGATMAASLRNAVANPAEPNPTSFEATAGRNSELRELLGLAILALDRAANGDRAEEARRLVRAALRANLDFALTRGRN